MSKTNERFIENFIRYIENNPFLDLDDDIQKTFILNYNNWNIQLIITPKVIKKSEKYNIKNIKDYYGSYIFDINDTFNVENKINYSFSNTNKELLNNNKNINKGKNFGEENMIEIKKNLNENIDQSLNHHNKPLIKQEKAIDNSHFKKKAKSPQKANLIFGKNIEHIEVESEKSKEYIERYKNPLEENKDNEMKPLGLYNFSLNSYMNSLLQCLFYIKELRDYFIQNKNKFTNEQPICKAFGEVMNELENSYDDYVEPKQFKTVMGNINNLFKGCKAVDVKDLFINLINSFLKELNLKNNIEESRNKDIDYSNKTEIFKEAIKKIDNNIINKIFIGYYETIFKCSKYNIDTYSIQTEYFLLFELEKIKNYFNTNKLSLELCFKYYYREQLNTEFYCSECQKTHKGNAYEKIYRPPKILLIVLDRGNNKIFKGDVEINKYYTIS